MQRGLPYLRVLAALCLAAMPLGLVIQGAAAASTSYEAESPGNTLSGGARVATCSACSGGHLVGFVGHGGTLRFNDVAAGSAGTYSLTIAYADGDAGRTGDLSVNGGAATAISFKNTGGWRRPGQLTTSVQLDAGANTITFSNPTAWAPDFDRITVSSAAPGPSPSPSTPPPTPAPSPSGGGGTTMHMLVTLYGWPDNSPPGAGIAYPVIHKQAGGVGTWQDPVTFATDQAEFGKTTRGMKVYVPTLKRYFIMEDDCVECDQDWTGHGPDGGPGFHHIDLWAGGNSSSGQAVIDCEDALTMNSGAVIINPPATLTVDTTPIFNASTNQCYTPH